MSLFSRLSSTLIRRVGLWFQHDPLPSLLRTFVLDFSFFCQFVDGFFNCTCRYTDCFSDFTERYFWIGLHHLLNLYRSFYRTFYRTFSRTVVRLFGRRSLLFPEYCGKEAFGLVFGRRESVFRKDTGDTWDTCADALDKVHPSEHPENERVSGATAVAEVCCDIGQQTAGRKMEADLFFSLKVRTFAPGGLMPDFYC